MKWLNCYVYNPHFQTYQQKKSNEIKTLKNTIIKKKCGSI